MAVIRVARFDGMIPAMSPRLLPTTSAVAAVNCNLFDGSLRGVRAPVLLRSMDRGPIIYQSTYRIEHAGEDDVWLDFPHPFTSCVKGPLVNDTFERYYWAAPGQPVRYNSLDRIRAGTPPLLLGMPTPILAPGLIVTGGTPATSTLPDVTRSYVYTYISAFGEESPPSPPVNADGPADATWTLTLQQPRAQDAGYAQRLYSKVRIYRTVTGTSGTAVFFSVVDLDVATESYADTVLDTVVAAGTELESMDWGPPPALEGFTVMPDGFLVGWLGRDIYFSEPYRPHAWPASYVVSVEHPVVGIGSYGQTAIIATKSHPVALTGTTPATVAMTKTQVVEPCMSQGSIVSASEGVYYASPNGLMLCNDDGIVNITQSIISKHDWTLRYQPQKMRAARYKTHYIGVNEDGQGFILNTASELVALTEFSSLLQGQNMVTDPWTGGVLLVGQNNIYEWDPEDSAMVAALWRSREFFLVKPVNFGALDIQLGEPDAPAIPIVVGSFGDNTSPLLSGQDSSAPITAPVVASTTRPAPAPDLGASVPFIGPAEQEFVRLDADRAMRIRIWANRQLVFDEQFDETQTVRLPSGFKSDLWQFEVLTRVPVMQVALAETAKELASV